MKKLLFIILLLPIMAWSQNDEKLTNIQLNGSLFVEWRLYLADCNELVSDTVSQSGTVKCELVPVKMNGKTVSYNTVPIDTVWNKCDCEKYKYGEIGFSNSSIGWIGGNGITLTSNTSWYSEPEPAKNTFSIKRNKICMIKKRKANFDDFFGRWCVEKKLVEFN
jgi:hypothetical protein